MVISEKIKARIEEYGRTLELNSPLVAKARRGEIGRDAVAAYLASLKYTLGQTPRHLDLSRRLALDSGRLQLADYFERKLVEESGHDFWAEQDLRVLKDSGEVEGTPGPLPTAVALMTFVEESIRRDPSLYVPYILFVEYITVLTGPSWVAALSEKCDIPRQAMTVIDKHVLADAVHAEEGFAEAAELLQEADASLEVLEESMRLFGCFTEEIAAIPN